MLELAIVGISIILNLMAVRRTNHFSVTSSAFSDKSRIPAKYANRDIRDGNNTSIPLEWSGVPKETKSIAISIVDIHPVASNWIHWLVIDISGKITSIPEGASGNNMPKGCRELDNSFGNSGYGGPQPPPGSGLHQYVVTLFALNVDKLELKQSTSLMEFQRAL